MGKYADAIMKDMAIGASIVLSSIGSIVMFGFIPTPLFMVGCVLVSYAVPLYGGRVSCGGLLAEQGVPAGEGPKMDTKDKEQLLPTGRDVEMAAVEKPTTSS